MTTVRVPVDHHQMLVEIAQRERRGIGEQLQILLERGAEAVGHQDLIPSRGVAKANRKGT